MAVDLRYVVEERAQRKGLAFATRHRSEHVSPRVVLDGRHLRQVLLNLLGNAIKFTPHGEIQLRIGPGAPGRLRFDVIDTGIGIEAENLSAVFQAFRQTRSGAELGGTGLGLTISHRLVRGMGGELKVESTPGKGSRFYFELPLVEAEAPVVQVAADADGDALSSDARLAPGEHLTALVADDSSVNRRILASLLESAGVRVITAAGGLEAVELGRTHRPDVVLMDLRMGDLNGFEATRRLGADEATAAIPVIAVSASAWDEVRAGRARCRVCRFSAQAGPRRRTLCQAAALHRRAVRRPGRRSRRRADRSSPWPATPASAHLAVRIREAAAIGSVADLDAIAAGLSAGGDAPGTLGHRIAALTAAFDYDALLRLAASLDQEPVDDAACGRSSTSSRMRQPSTVSPRFSSPDVWPV